MEPIIIKAVTVAQLKEVVTQEWQNGHDEAEAAGKMSTLAARHYGAAIRIAELIDDNRLDSIVAQYKEDKRQ